MDLMARLLIIALSLFLVPGTTIRVAIFIHSLDAYDLLGTGKHREKEARFCRQLRMAARLLLVVSLLVMWFVPSERPWAYAALGLLAGYRGKYFIQASSLRGWQKAGADRPGGTLDYYEAMLGVSLGG